MARKKKNPKFSMLVFSRSENVRESNSYQNALIYHFSGGGNALRASKWIATKLSEKGINTSVIPFNKIKEKSQESKERMLIGFVFPTHGFTIIWSMLLAILSFLKSQNKDDVFILSTVGGMKIFSLFIPGFPGSSLILAQIILTIKGYRVVGTTALNMPVHWAALFPPMGRKTNIAIVNRCKGIAEGFIEKILNGQRTYYYWWLLPIIIASIPISFIYLFVGRLGLPKIYFFSTECNGCGICKNNCPVNAIKMLGNRPYWTIRCESCQRCINFCPNKAIQASLIYMILIFLVYSAIFDKWFGLKLNEFLAAYMGIFAGITSFIIWNVLCILLLYATYPIMLMLIRIKFINTILTYTSITRYYGRYREPGTKIQDFDN